MPLFNVTLNIIEEIEKLTIKNEQFDINQWCLNDADILIKAGEMIKRELQKHKKPAHNPLKARDPLIDLF